ncbi:uncharacterized protein F4822DRAFT_13889 [Hypoxylon trugodes]|uniref:uncharacterized protein n=1 Tax=Hypoxylon trugodes TaxID=326681 RepID=UPI00218E43FF|nr:uncharacterized protein F4822DRAFT_13889 [Hypoxylon trugodes]KAI1393460.1 hypothetical protein F4822DRAFT_13889 [Hypoxylon trugodes]
MAGHKRSMSCKPGFRYLRFNGLFTSFDIFRPLTLLTLPTYTIFPSLGGLLHYTYRSNIKRYNTRGSEHEITHCFRQALGISNGLMTIYQQCDGEHRFAPLCLSYSPSQDTSSKRVPVPLAEVRVVLSSCRGKQARVASKPRTVGKIFCDQHDSMTYFTRLSVRFI